MFDSFLEKCNGFVSDELKNDVKELYKNGNASDKAIALTALAEMTRLRYE
jgi:hypothetical protein